jgi:hypothetical protein
MPEVQEGEEDRVLVLLLLLVVVVLLLSLLLLLFIQCRFNCCCEVDAFCIVTSVGVLAAAVSVEVTRGTATLTRSLELFFQPGVTYKPGPYYGAVTVHYRSLT